MKALIALLCIVRQPGWGEDEAEIGVRENDDEEEKEGQGGILGMLSTANRVIFLDAATWTKGSIRNCSIVDLSIKSNSGGALEETYEQNVCVLVAVCVCLPLSCFVAKGS